MDAQVARKQQDLEKKKRQLQQQVNKQFSKERKKLQHLEKEAKQQAKENVIVDKKGQPVIPTITSNQGKVLIILQVVNCFLDGRYVLVSLYVMIIQHLNSLHFHNEPLKLDSNIRLEILD